MTNTVSDLLFNVPAKSFFKKNIVTQLSDVLDGYMISS